MVHEKHKPYKCDTCDKNFGLKHSLKSHIFKAHNIVKLKNIDSNDSMENTMKNISENPIKYQMENPIHDLMDNNVSYDSPLENQTDITLMNPTENPMENLKLHPIKNIIEKLHDLTENPIEDPIFIKEVIKVEEMPHTIIKTKTKVEISVNGNTDNVNWLKISKPSNSITLNDIKKLLMIQPKMYGMSNEMTYQYRVKTTDGGKVGFDHIDEEDDSILPLFGDKIELQCWSK